MKFWMREITNIFSKRPLTEEYFYKKQRILYSKDSITYYNEFEDIMRIISILVYKKEFQLFYSFASCIIFNFKPC